MTIKFIKKSFLLSLLVLTACADDLSMNPKGGGIQKPEDVIDMQNSLAIPFTINVGEIDPYTRDEASAAADDESFQKGTISEHIIDFDKEKECYAFFFKDNGDFMYMKRLWRNSSLGNGTVPTDENSEFEQFAVAYIDKPKFRDRRENESIDDYLNAQKAWEQSDAADGRLPLLPGKVLVVLNGGLLYDKIIRDFEIDRETGESSKTNLTTQDFLDIKWDYQLSMDPTTGVEDDPNGDPDENRLSVIGKNEDGHFTMTNSAYFGPDLELNDQGVEEAVVGSGYSLQTVRPVYKRRIVDAISSQIIQSNFAAKVYVERMVAKFSPPVFPTERIGESKVIDPAQSARAVSIYTYDAASKIWTSEDVNWKVKVLGWTINGREKVNYLYKHIQDAYDGDKLKNWSKDDWNDADHRRSYWSQDLHYNYNPNNEVNDNGDFYPWQYRGALDKEHISWSHQFNSNEERNNIALRYVTFNELKKSWNENDLTISENTFYPYDAEDKYIINNSNYLDSRASVLMGPHLLVAAQIRIADSSASDNAYDPNYKTLNNLYGDRFYRYYTTEKDMFRMFIKYMNDALLPQSKMSFKVYVWDEDDRSGNNDPQTAEVASEGNCQVMIDLEQTQAELGRMTDDELHVYQALQAYNNAQTDPAKKLHKRAVADVIDILADVTYVNSTTKIPLCIQANVKDGDGRVLPWLPGMVFRNINDFDTRLVVRNITTGTTYPYWTDNLRKSLIFQWYGTVDHYLRGYMYYAADIPHHVTTHSVAEELENTEEGEEDEAPTMRVDNNTAMQTYYGVVRNHWYTFKVNSINALGTPVSDLTQRIIPAKYKYRDQISVHINPEPWHFIREVQVGY